MTGNPECDTLWSGSHIQKRLRDPSCSSWEEEGDQRRLGGEELEAEPITLDSHGFRLEALECRRVFY